MNKNRSFPAQWLMLMAMVLMAGAVMGGGKVSDPISVVLREPLPPEELSLTSNSGEWIITGPTFIYRVRKNSGAISALRVLNNGREVIGTTNPVDVQIDGNYRLASELTTGEMTVVTHGKDKIVMRGHGVLRDQAKAGSDVDYTLEHTFFDDGVVVSSVKLSPRQDLVVRKEIAFHVETQGEFSHYLHKRRDENGGDAVRGGLPETGRAVHFSTLTSCLQVFSTSATLAIFTDCGATHLSRRDLDSATVDVLSREKKHAAVRLGQYLIHVAAGDKPYLLKAGEEFSFRVGISVAPNRIAHRRQHDLRMFAWIGDAQYPYATDQEIESVARAGYTLFQMHRLGTPGEPRPPSGELERVIKKVHEMGMLFLWTENADLMYDNAPGVRELKAKGQWPLWQGFNIDGNYKATMDPYCNLACTCMASPNGLAEYRLATINRMMKRFDVDGIYLDDNMAYPTCRLGQEHGHPQKIYDCLIELHEMNWRRRELLRQKNPHQVLVSHNTRGIIQPVICDFDAILYGEGYSFGSLEDYRDYYRPVDAIPAQGMIWPGGQDAARCAASVAYNYDLLTGGGQYCHIDWRMFPKKFPYAAGVTDTEQTYVRTYNLAQYYFGLYESKPFYFAESSGLFSTSAPQTYATLYHNQVWNDWLIPVANMSSELRKTSLQIRAPQTLGIDPQAHYVLFNIHQRTVKHLNGDRVNEALSEIAIPAQSLQLFAFRSQPADGPYHLWGGKRLSESWDRRKRKLTLTLQGPAGLQDTIFIACESQAIDHINVNGKPASFSYDPAQRMAHGPVTFTSRPLKIEVIYSSGDDNKLPTRPATPDPLGNLFDH
ncbi:MAG: hypothetical protein JWO95_2418 [Verrucomicrobiales bacterium]|nr:hypothetical protein [Verrucomicrobiales bacterium]